MAVSIEEATRLAKGYTPQLGTPVHRRQSQSSMLCRAGSWSPANAWSHLHWQEQWTRASRRLR